MENLEEMEMLFQLIKERNHVDRRIASMIGRPALKQNIGEFIAARILRIKLEKSGSNPGFDGRFRQGLLAGQTVNIKYLKDDGNIDLNEKNTQDYYLVMTSPRMKDAVSCVTLLPLCIKGVFLFKADDLANALTSENPDKKLGDATRVPQLLWSKAEIYPTQSSNRLLLTDEQRNLFALFDPARVVDIP